ncbi:MAG TPA: MCE family protein [Nocardioidaceae bacterium]|nr:MCE family protein [Nocardioidaceae bacterium]
MTRVLTETSTTSPWEIRERSRLVTLGLGGTMAIVVAVTLALTGSLFTLFSSASSYTAEFTEAGGLVKGDDVIVSGVTVGAVTSVALRGDHVAVEFEIAEKVQGLGTSTSAAVVSRTVLGKKALLVVPRGSGTLRPGSTIPTSRTIPSFDVTNALNQLTKNVAAIDTDQLSTALDEVSEVLQKAAPDVQPALEGVSRLSKTLSSRDEQLGTLLKSSAGVSTLLAARDQQVQTLFADGSTFLAALNEQRKALDELFENATAMATQLSGLATDNRQQLGPALREINALLALLQKNRANIDHALDSAGPLVRELGEVVAAFPGFNVYVPNLAPTNLVPVVPNLLSKGSGR